MTDRERVAPQWMFFHDGVYGPADEQELRDFGKRLGIFSDSKGIASAVMEQMWEEIDRLRAALAAMPTWRRIPGEVREGEAPFDGRPVELWHTAINCRLIDQLWHPRARMFVQEDGACTKLSEVSWWMPSPPLPAPPAGEVGVVAIGYANTATGGAEIDNAGIIRRAPGAVDMPAGRGKE